MTLLTRTGRAAAFIILLLAFTASAAGAAPETDQQQRENTYRKLELFSNILSILQERYVEEIDTEKVIDGAIDGLLLSLDPHSSYLNPEDFKELQDETQGSFTGIGIEITMRDGELTVVSPIEDTPAFAAGIQANDIIVKIGEEWTDDMTPMEAVKKLRGPKGSEVTISIHRQGWENLKELTLVRDIIPVQSVRSVSLDEGIVYTRITTFQSHTTNEYLEALETMSQLQPIRGLILDLRNNPGGLLNQAVSIADLFLDSGLIVYTKGRTEDQNMVFQARKDSTVTDAPLIVLVNEGSASASEIVAGAIQDHKRGLVLGTPTFGKGSVQTIIPLQGGAGLRMTTARYFTPSGRSIQVKGIHPDVEVRYRSAAEKKEEDGEAANGGYRREEDLPNHFRNIDKSDDKTKAKEDDAAEQLPEVSDRQSELLGRLQEDNQVQMALNILKGIVLFSTSAQAD